MTSKHTPGPWDWTGNKYGIYLATTHSGRRYVMGFQRMGLQSAQPVFQGEKAMVPAADLVEFEVGDQSARGFKAGLADPTVYRLDVRGIDHPDARLIAAAPDLLEALKATLKAMRYHRDRAPRTIHQDDDRVDKIAVAAIAKAEGGQ